MFTYSIIKLTERKEAIAVSAPLIKLPATPDQISAIAKAAKMRLACPLTEELPKAPALLGVG